MKETPRHVAIYLRISMEKRGEDVETLANHRDILTKFCKKKGWTYELYEEVLSAGTSDMERRPKLQALLGDLDHYDGIVCYELTRLSRNGLISERVLDMCIKTRTPIITPYQEYDLANNENDVLFYRFQSIIASAEHMAIGRRSKENKLVLARQGQFVTGRVPYGYVRDEHKKLQIDEEVAVVIRTIYDLYAKGHGDRTIADELNKMGFKPERADFFTYSTVSRILQNPAYKGQIYYTDRKRVWKENKYTYEIEEVVIVDDAHPAIIEPRVFDKIQKEREARVDNCRNKPAFSFQSTVKDLIFCAKCGKKMRITKGSDEHRVQIRNCSHRVGEGGARCGNNGAIIEMVERAVLEHVKNYREELRAAIQVVERGDLEAQLGDYYVRIKSTKEKIMKNEARQENLLNMALDGLFGRDEIMVKKDELMKEHRALTKTLERLEHELAELNLEDVKDTMEEVVDILENIDDLPPTVQNTVLRKVIKKIHYLRDLPPEIEALRPRVKARREYPVSLEIEYIV